MAKARVAYGDQTFWLLDYGDCENISNDEFGFPACWKGGPVIAPGVESLQQPKTFWQFNMVQVVSRSVFPFSIKSIPSLSRNGKELMHSKQCRRRLEIE